MNDDRCNGCGHYVDQHADNHECPGSLDERVEYLEDIVEALRDDSASMQRCLNAMAVAIAEYIRRDG